MKSTHCIVCLFLGLLGVVVWNRLKLGFKPIRKKIWFFCSKKFFRGGIGSVLRDRFVKSDDTKKM